MKDFEGVDDVVLYDMFANANTVLGGWIIAEADRAQSAGDKELAEAWWREHASIGDEKRSIRGDDREAQIRAHARWHARKQQIDAGAGPREPPFGKPTR